MAITVLLEAQLKSDSLDDAYAAVHTTLGQTRAFAGNLGVEVVTGREDPALAVVIEHWESFEAHEAYLKWRETSEGAPTALAAVLAAAPVTRTFSDATGI